jgi:hypothetical protein
LLTPKSLRLMVPVASDPVVYFLSIGFTPHR